MKSGRRSATVPAATLAGAVLVASVLAAATPWRRSSEVGGYGRSNRRLPGATPEGRK